MGALNEQAALSCSRDKDVAHSLPDGRGRKEGRGVCAERTCSCGSGRKAAGREGSPGPWGEQLNLSWPHSLAPVLLPCSSLSLLLASSAVPHLFEGHYGLCEKLNCSPVLDSPSFPASSAPPSVLPSCSSCSSVSAPKPLCILVLGGEGEARLEL